MRWTVMPFKTSVLGDGYLRRIYQLRQHIGSLISTGVQLASNTIVSKSTSLQYASFVLGVLGLESAIATYVFKCPCVSAGNTSGILNRHATELRLAYVVSFCVWPAITLFLLVLLSSRHTERCMTGAARRERGCCRDCSFFCSGVWYALLTAAAWLIFVLLDGRYYQCAASDILEDCLNSSTTNGALLEQVRSENSYHRAMSQFAGWSALGILALLTSLVLVCKRVCSATPYYQQRWLQERCRKEEETFVKVSQALLDGETTAEWSAFLKDENFTGHTQEWCRISRPPSYTAEGRDPVFAYSPLAEWYRSASNHSENPPQSSVTNADDNGKVDASKNQSHTYKSNILEANNDILAANVDETVYQLFDIPVGSLHYVLPSQLSKGSHADGIGYHDPGDLNHKGSRCMFEEKSEVEVQRAQPTNENFTLHSITDSGTTSRTTVPRHLLNAAAGNTNTTTILRKNKVDVSR